MNQLTALVSYPAPALVATAGDRTTYRFLEFFTAQICNPNTRRAYVKSVGEFCTWLERHGSPSITAVSSIHIAAYVEVLGRSHSAPTVKQRLAAIRMMFDRLATGGVLPFNIDEELGDVEHPCRHVLQHDAQAEAEKRERGAGRPCDTEQGRQGMQRGRRVRPETIAADREGMVATRLP